MTTYLEMLSEHLSQHGPIPTVRVSSARARGAARQYSYWGAVRYEVRLDRQGRPQHAALERASSDRRSVRLAGRDADATGRLRCQRIGRLTEGDARDLMQALANGAGLQEKT